MCNSFLFFFHHFSSSIWYVNFTNIIIIMSKMEWRVEVRKQKLKWNAASNVIIIKNQNKMSLSCHSTAIAGNQLFSERGEEGALHKKSLFEWKTTTTTVRSIESMHRLYINCQFHCDSFNAIYYKTSHQNHVIQNQMAKALLEWRLPVWQPILHGQILPMAHD